MVNKKAHIDGLVKNSDYNGEYGTIVGMAKGDPGCVVLKLDTDGSELIISVDALTIEGLIRGRGDMPEWQLHLLPLTQPGWFYPEGHPLEGQVRKLDDATISQLFVVLDGIKSIGDVARHNDFKHFIGASFDPVERLELYLPALLKILKDNLVVALVHTHAIYAARWFADLVELLGSETLMLAPDLAAPVRALVEAGDDMEQMRAAIRDLVPCLAELVAATAAMRPSSFDSTYFWQAIMGMVAASLEAVDKAKVETALEAVQGSTPMPMEKVKAYCDAVPLVKQAKENAQKGLGEAQLAETRKVLMHNTPALLDILKDKLVVALVRTNAIHAAHWFADLVELLGSETFVLAPDLAALVRALVEAGGDMEQMRAAICDLVPHLAELVAATAAMRPSSFDSTYFWQAIVGMVAASLEAVDKAKVETALEAVQGSTPMEKVKAYCDAVPLVKQAKVTMKKGLEEAQLAEARKVLMHNTPALLDILKDKLVVALVHTHAIYAARWFADLVELLGSETLMLAPDLAALVRALVKACDDMEQMRAAIRDLVPHLAELVAATAAMRPSSFHSTRFWQAIVGMVAASLEAVDKAKVETALEAVQRSTPMEKVKAYCDAVPLVKQAKVTMKKGLEEAQLAEARKVLMHNTPALLDILKDKLVVALVQTNAIHAARWFADLVELLGSETLMLAPDLAALVRALVEAGGDMEQMRAAISDLVPHLAELVAATAAMRPSSFHSTRFWQAIVGMVAASLEAVDKAKVGTALEAVQGSAPTKKVKAYCGAVPLVKQAMEGLKQTLFKKKVGGRKKVGPTAAELAAAKEPRQTRNQKKNNKKNK